MINNLRKRTQRPEADITAKDVSKVLRMIRPSFQREGGNLELVSINDRTVTIRLIGARDGGPINFDESAGVIERIVRSRVPQIHRLTVV